MGDTRNGSVDVLRGAAILMVVLGHTMSVGSIGSEESFLYQVIWSLQMPLFFLISGYVTQYSRPVKSGKQLLDYIVKKTRAYLLPWGIWTFVVRGLVFGQTSWLDLRYLLWHMDSGYWFLCSLWMINILFGLAQFAARKYSGWKGTAVICTVYGVGAVALGCIGLIAGLSFLCIKLTLYYMPFYLLGHIYGRYAGRIPGEMKQIAAMTGLFLWLAIILRVDLYAIEDGLYGIALRAIASLSGCAAAVGMICGLQADSQGFGMQLLKKAGKHSLEIYLLHYLLMNMIRLSAVPEWGTAKAVALVAVNYALTLAVTMDIADLLNTNKFFRKFLFGKA